MNSNCCFHLQFPGGIEYRSSIHLLVCHLPIFVPYLGILRKILFLLLYDLMSSLFILDHSLLQDFYGDEFVRIKWTYTDISFANIFFQSGLVLVAS